MKKKMSRTKHRKVLSDVSLKTQHIILIIKVERFLLTTVERWHQTYSISDSYPRKEYNSVSIVSRFDPKPNTGSKTKQYCFKLCLKKINNFYDIFLLFEWDIIPKIVSNRKSGSCIILLYVTPSPTVILFVPFGMRKTFLSSTLFTPIEPLFH